MPRGHDRPGATPAGPRRVDRRRRPAGTPRPRELAKPPRPGAHRAGPASRRRRRTRAGEAPGLLSAGIFAFAPVGAITELIRGDVFYWGQLMAAALLGSIELVAVDPGEGDHRGGPVVSEPPREIGVSSGRTVHRCETGAQGHGLWSWMFPPSNLSPAEYPLLRRMLKVSVCRAGSPLSTTSTT